MGRPPKFDERSEEIMLAFEACVLRKGLSATTLTDVADESRLPRSLVRYFMGNRDDMVDRLVERLMTVARRRLDNVRDAEGGLTVERLLDAYFGEIFADDRSNALVGELWYLARTDPHIRERLNGVYAYALGLLSEALAKEHAAIAAEQRDAAAFAILSLVIGQSSLNDFGLAAPATVPLRRHAERIIMSFRTEIAAC